MRHERYGPPVSKRIDIVELADSSAIRFAQFHSELCFADPAHRRFLDQKRMLRGWYKQHHELHAYADHMCAV